MCLCGLKINLLSCILYTFHSSINTVQEYKNLFNILKHTNKNNIGSWYLWYRRLFVAVALKKPNKFWIFNINFLFHNLFVIVMLIGFPSLNAAGVLLLIQTSVHDENHDHVTMLGITTTAWFVNLVLSCLLAKKTHDIQNQIRFSQFMKERFESIL